MIYMLTCAHSILINHIIKELCFKQSNAFESTKAYACPKFWGRGGGVESTFPFLFVKTIEKVIRLCTVLIFFLSGSFEDMGFSSILFYLSICYGSI